MREPINENSELYIGNSMKNRFILFIMCLCCISCTQEYTTIQGKADVETWKTLTLFQTVDGSMQECATAPVGEDGNYSFKVKPEAPGFYAIGDKRINFILYLKGGEEVNIDLEKTKATLNGKNTKENKSLYIWEDYAANIRLKSVYWDLTISTYEDFFPEFEVFVAGQDDLKKKLKSGNKTFDEALLKLVDYETDYYAIIFLFTPRSKHPERSMWPDYYNHIMSDEKFTTDDVLQFPYGARIIDSYAGFADAYYTRDEGVNYHDFTMSYLHTDCLKGVYLLNSKFNTFSTYDDYLAAMEKYGKYLVTPSLKKRAEAIGAKFYAWRSGAPAIDFTYPDAEGKMVSLSDFKGKVVLVDVWATWCGPCRGEVPHLKKLEKEMHGKDVVFVSVSIDDEKDKQVWLDFIKKEQLGGVQLFAANDDAIKKAYDIGGIPRFMLFDKAGCIVTIRAPRPSEPELKELLERELEK